MDDRRFDAATTRLAAAPTRRAALVSGLAALLVPFRRAAGAGAEAKRDCRGICRRCSNNGDCCSRTCLGDVCLCRERGPCAGDRQCCSRRCRANGTCRPAPAPRCAPRLA